eukprot:scaffold47_cov258-Pinguiococcus_pyrenoidosus.AAC.93
MSTGSAGCHHSGVFTLGIVWGKCSGLISTKGPLGAIDMPRCRVSKLRLEKIAMNMMKSDPTSGRTCGGCSA